MPRKKYIPKLYQKRPGGSNRFSMLHDDKVDSPAFHDLTSKQVRLYLYCERESHGAASRDNDGYPNREQLFYMNKALRVKKHELYSENDSRGFERDMASLIEHGFVDCVEAHYHSSYKNLYKLSARWHHWGEPGFELPDDCLTFHMRKNK